MKKVYLVDSENVGDIWVPLLVSSQPEDEILVFYTQKSPHMNYENVRMLKETEKEAVFIKCFEGNNALDFQLVTELGYLLCGDGDCEYVIVTNDTGFDAVVRYWSAKNKQVSRLSGKECYRQVTNRSRKKEPQPEDMTEGTGPQADPESRALAATAEDGAAPQKTGFSDAVETGGESARIAGQEAEVLQEAGCAGESAKEQAGPEESVSAERKEPSLTADTVSRSGKELQGQRHEKPAVEDAAGWPQETAEEEPDTQPKEPALPADAAEPEAEVVSEAEPVSGADEPGHEMPEETSRSAGAPEAQEQQKQPQDNLPEAVQSEADIAQETVAGLTEEVRCVVSTLFGCISKDHLADFHNALVMFFGEETGKGLYQEIKGTPEWNTEWAGIPESSQKEKFDAYCKMVFEHSELADSYPQDFSGFLLKAGGKRKNLNSLRAALQGQYGKDRGMKYYSLFKSHIKIMNRM